MTGKLDALLQSVFFKIMAALEGWLLVGVAVYIFRTTVLGIQIRSLRYYRDRCTLTSTYRSDLKKKHTCTNSLRENPIML